MEVPLKFDEMTLKGDYSHFACILIDVDLFKPLPDSLMLEVGENCLFPSMSTIRIFVLLAALLVMWYWLAVMPENSTLSRRSMIREGKKPSLHEFRLFTAPRTSLTKLRKMLWRFRISQGLLSL